MRHHRGKVLLFALLVLLAQSRPVARAETGFSSLLDSDKTISMDLQEANLKDVLKIFSIQSGLNFIASEAVKDRKVTLYLDNVPIKEAMIKLFKSNKLIYDFDEEANIFTVSYADDIAEPDMITRIFALQHRSVASSNFEKERQNIFSGTSVTSGTFSTNQQSGAPAQTQQDESTTILGAVKQLLSKNGKATEDNRTNTIIVTDLASRFGAIEELIARLDVPQPQVMLEVEMLDVSKDIVDKMGFNFGDNPLTLVLGHNKNSAFFGNLNYRGGNIKTALTDGEATYSAEGHVILGSMYAQMLDFLKQQQDTKYLARPRILTMNNETAEIGITKDEVVSSKRTEEGTGEDRQVTIEFERATSLKLTPEGVGIFLRVTPSINLETGEVTLVVNPKTSSTTESDLLVVQDGEEVRARDPEVRSSKSIVKVKDGDTVILGGLIHQQKDQTKAKVPLLGDIPLVGALFRHRDMTQNLERELLVFITPRIVRDSAAQYSRAARPASAAAARNPAVPSERRQAIANMLNTFER